MATQIKVEIEYLGDRCLMEWAPSEASAPILLDGQSTPYQTADARHRTADAVRLMAKIVWPEVDWSADEGAWDELSYGAPESEVSS